MICPHCDKPTAVLDSRPGPHNSIRRRRQCEGCGHRFTTYETVTDPIKLIGQRRAALRAFKARMTPEERSAYNKRYELRRSAREEAAETGEDVQAIYARWNVA